MGLRTEVCFALARTRIQPPAERAASLGQSQIWRDVTLREHWAAFGDKHAKDKDVLDFGCGNGALCLFLAIEKAARSAIGVDLRAEDIARAQAAAAQAPVPAGSRVEFLVGSVSGVPMDDASVDTLVAFDCMEHIMQPVPVLRDWRRVLRPGGRCLIKWFPFKGPWGSHMAHAVPVPWAHVLFGERALFETADRIYNLPQYQPRHWERDAAGNKLPKSPHTARSFAEQNYLNRLDLAGFRRVAQESGMRIARLEKHSFGGAPWRRWLGRALMSLPILGEYFVSHVDIELESSPE